MKIEILPIYLYLNDYVRQLESGAPDAPALWEKYAVAPWWKHLCRYAPMDLADRKPKCIKNTAQLRQQLELLQELDLSKLQAQFERAAAALPNFDENPITVALYPLSDSNQVVRERQNGVIGCSLFGNIMICINPLADDFATWVPYVFAHEYHHAVWGNYWYALNVGKLDNCFLSALICEGQADSFALSLYPHLRPQWLFGLSEQTLAQLWNDVYGVLAEQKDVDYVKYMFGRGEIPWCAGYAVGYWFFDRLRRQFPGRSWVEWIQSRPLALLDNQTSDFHTDRQ